MTRTVRYARMDPTGNITLLVETPVALSDQTAVAARLMEREPTAEQAGFLSSESHEDIALRMAGGEFCGNAAMSAAVICAMDRSVTAGRFTVSVSGAERPVSVMVRALSDGLWQGEVAMPRPLSVTWESFPDGISRPVVRFHGIAHVILEQAPDRAAAEDMAPRWCRALGVPALGLMFWDRDGGAMTPLVYVPDADTLFWETSCGSGTAAIGAWLAEEAGGPVTVSLRQPGGVLTVSASADGDLALAGTVRLQSWSTAEIDL